MHRRTPNWTLTLNSQKCSIHTKYLLLSPNFCSISLYDLPFSEIQHVHLGENWKCTEWPQMNLSTRQSKVLSIYLMLTPEAQILVRFALRLAVCEIHVQGGRNRICTEWPQTEFELLTDKSTLYTLNTYSWSISVITMGIIMHDYKNCAVLLRVCLSMKISLQWVITSRYFVTTLFPNLHGVWGTQQYFFTDEMVSEMVSGSLYR